MPSRIPKTYDEIVRRTVPEPDSSWRPTPDQEKQAIEGFRAMDANEQELFDRIDEVLATSGCDVSHVNVEIDRDHVILRGSVRHALALNRVFELVRGVRGVAAIIDRLVIAPD